MSTAKYAIGDHVWIWYHGYLLQTVVRSVHYGTDWIQYEVGPLGWELESAIYRTQEELKASAASEAAQ